MTDLPDETKYRFVAVLNKKVEIGRLLNALGHMTAGLAGGHPDSSNFNLLRYTDADGGVHPNISHFPYIVLKADNSNQLRTLRNELIGRGLPCTDFTNTMIIGTSQEQQNATKATHEADLEYFGVCTFADTETLRSLTKRFQLFK
jgi:uncharacterized protein DUF2000